MKYICADIRTDVVVYSLADETGQLSESKEIPVTEGDWKSVVQALHAIVRSYDGEEILGGLALSVPCLVEPGEGIILLGEGKDIEQDYPLAESMSAACGLPCSVENTVKCTALGEYWLGAGQRSHLLFCLNMGNRISGAVVIDGCVLHGASFSAGEIGYMKIGSSATFGEAASIQALLQNVAAARQVPAASLDEKKLFRQAKSGDVVAIMAIRRLIDHMAAGIANICYLYNPDMVIIGGSLAAQMRYIRPLLMEELKKRLRPIVYEHTRVTFAHLGETAALSGALYWLLQKVRHHDI